MVKRDDPSGQNWGTFLRNHAPHIAAMDLFVVPTIGFIQLYVVVIVRLARRELALMNVTRRPTAEWIAQQITEAFPWNDVPRYLVRDQDAIYGAAVVRRLCAILSNLGFRHTQADGRHGSLIPTLGWVRPEECRSCQDGIFDKMNPDFAC